MEVEAEFCAWKDLVLAAAIQGKPQKRHHRNKTRGDSRCSGAKLLFVQKRLDNFKSNVHSQNGEDGVIAELIQRIGLVVNKDFWCVEFGAWDGVHLSNTFALVESHSATAVMIEGDTQKFEVLKETAAKYPSIIPLEGFVTGNRVPETSPTTNLFTGSFDPKKVATLDQLLSGTHCPQDYDLLSIDIDSYDLEVWAAHRDFKPKIVVIEINSALQPGILQWHGGGNVGNSFSSTLAVAKGKGYSLVCHTGNMIFVRNDLAHLADLDELDSLSPERLFNAGWLSSRHSPETRLSKNIVLRPMQGVIRRILGL